MLGQLLRLILDLRTGCDDRQGHHQDLGRLETRRPASLAPDLAPGQNFGLRCLGVGQGEQQRDPPQRRRPAARRVDRSQAVHPGH